MPTHHAAPAAPPRHPWVVLCVISLAGFALIGGMLTSLSVYLSVIQPHFGWTETELGGGPVALLLGMSLGNLLVAPAMQRIGARGLVASGCAMAAAGWIAAAQTTGLAQFMVAMGLSGLGVGAATIVPGIAILSQAFDRRRGLAIALFIGSCALASAIMPIATGRLIAAFGWSGTFRMTGAATLALCPALFALLPLTGSTAGDARQADSGLSRGEAMRLPAFWILLAVMTVSQLCMNGVLFNVIACLTKHGQALPDAVNLFSLTNFLSLPGLLLGGWLSDRVSPVRLLPAIIGLQAIGTLALLAITPDSPVRLLGIVGFAVIWGGISGLPSQTGSMVLVELAGARSFAALLGIVFTVNGFIGALAPGITGWLHDLTGGYALPFGLFSALLALAALISRGCRPASI